MARRTTMSHTPPPDHSAAAPLAGRSIQPRFGQLAQGSRERAMNHLEHALSRTFDAADDALFAQANRAASNQEQARLFDGMQAVRGQREGEEGQEDGHPERVIAVGGRQAVEGAAQAGDDVAGDFEIVEGVVRHVPGHD